MPETSPFGTWNGRDSWEFVEGVRLHAIGGEQVLLCRVQYEPGKQVPWHAHEDTEQVMFVIDGEVEMTIEDETKTLAVGERRRRQPWPAPQAVLGGRRDIHGGARAGAARSRA